MDADDADEEGELGGLGVWEGLGGGVRENRCGEEEWGKKGGEEEWGRCEIA